MINLCSLWAFIAIIYCPISSADTTLSREGISLSGEESTLPTIAIIIDDMGNYRNEGWQLINMPYPLTLSLHKQKQPISWARKSCCMRP